MKTTMTTAIQTIGLLLIVTFLFACDANNTEHAEPAPGAHGESSEMEPEKGPHRGRLLKDNEFTLELAIFETGVPPEFRAWTTQSGKPLAPEEVDLKVNLTRLGGKVDKINFKPLGDALRGDSVIYEPHSFIVEIIATHGGVKHQWQYENFEGRTKIESAVADALEIKTAIAGPVAIQNKITVYGQFVANTELVRRVSARFEGAIKSVSVSLGDRISKDQTLATIESNESLEVYTIKAPIDGVVTERNANPGEQTNNRQLFTIVDTSSLWAELSVFPRDLPAITVGAPVTLFNFDGEPVVSAKISQINRNTEPNQSVKVRALIDNKDGKLSPGGFITAKITIGQHKAALAVKRSGLQAFRDFTVVYAQIGEEYEVRMLELGLQTEEWAEVLGGLEPGTRYVSENSYVIKADIEKSGAAHDH